MQAIQITVLPPDNFDEDLLEGLKDEIAREVDNAIAAYCGRRRYYGDGRFTEDDFNVCDLIVEEMSADDKAAYLDELDKG